MKRGQKITICGILFFLGLSFLFPCVVGGQAEEKKLSSTQKKILEIVDVKVVDPNPAVAGSVVKVTLKGSFKLPAHHTYPILKLEKGQANSELEFDPNPELLPLPATITESEPEKHKSAAGESEYEYRGDFTFTEEIHIKPETTPGKKKLTVKLTLVVCKDPSGESTGFCYPPTEYPGLTTTITVLEGKAVPAPAGLDKLTKKPSTNTNTNTDNSQGLNGGLLGLLLSAFVGAFLMLLTPCVFPMIPITVNFFLKQSEKEHHNALFTALVYSGTIVVLLTAIMLTFGKFAIILANDPWFNLVLGLVLIIFALSLFGMYEIELPSGLARFTSAREGQGGYLGAVFMALTFTITSFTCTGPFLGAMMAPVSALKPPDWQLVLAALVYSLTFAAPFFILALFPTLLKALPKSGGWLNAIKVTMGFLEIGAALKFLSNTDLVWNPGDPKLFNYDTVLCAWMALSVACGLYLIGTFRLPHDDKVEHIGVVRMLFACLFFGLAVYMTPLLRGETPSGTVGEGIVAFLPPSYRHASELPWNLKPEQALAEWKASKDKKLVFIDITGQQCTNCRANEKNVFARSDVQKELKKYVLLQLYTDSVPIKGLDSSKAKELASQFLAWQEKIAGSLALPTYVIFEVDTKDPFRDGQLNGRVLGTTDGLISNVNGFLEFIRKPLDDKGVDQPKVAELGWHKSFPDDSKEASAKNRLMFLNFTSVQNTNCAANEK